MPKFDPYLSVGPYKAGQHTGVTLSYVQAARLDRPLGIHPLLACVTWDPKPYGKYISWNVVEFPALACVYIDYDEMPTGLIKERWQPATSPKVEELHLLHDVSGWTMRIANTLGVNVTDVLTGIFDFFAAPLYVDELGEMHPRAVRVMEQQYFEKRQQGFADSFLGYRKSDALLNMTYFKGIRYDLDLAFLKLNFRATNVFILSLGNC
ncbi:hypothetical protein BD324DRAFT_627589 [Kockovaella imperatae]|uniref:DUF6699 domain-containing protein n=1 Tax=Kockovaella imperatae TaxID=4999 RepID=A0A1Y1UFR3_9TREE|nr:hypothetical protein BD324DRAFT_627589 [Kockovaella imperatae]ORX36893.1 hypothetical protein BD324DRAFT_627589 [Kockovaella imperatae]